MRKFALFLVLFSSAFAQKIYKFEITNMECVSCYEVVMDCTSKFKQIKNAMADLSSKILTFDADDSFDTKALVLCLKNEGYEAILKGVR